MKKLLTMMMVIGLISMTATACGSGDSEETAQVNAEGQVSENSGSGDTGETENGSQAEEKVLTYAHYRDIRDLNPHLYGGELYAQNLIYEGLIKIEADGSLSPWLAESYSVSEDGLEYTFKIREGITFHDGEILDAQVVKMNLDALLDNVDRHGWLESIRLMSEVVEAGGQAIEVTGDYEVVVRLAESYYPFLVELGMTRPFRITSPATFIDGTTKNGVSAIIGTGSYELQANHIDEYAVFVRNENYWAEEPEIDKIIVKVIPDDQTRLLALESGEIDLLYGTNLVSAEAYNMYTAKEGFQSVMSEALSTRMMLFNTAADVTGDVNVRKAIMHAVNKEAISLGLFDGIEPPADFLFGENVPYANIGLTPYAYDVDKANAILEEGGWVLDGDYRVKDGQPLAITLYYNSNNVTDKAVCEFMQSELKKIGVNLEIVGEEEQANEDRMKAGDFQFAFNVAWGTPYDPQSFVGSMRKPVYGDYFAQLGLENKEELDQHILDALKSVDEEERQAHYTYVLETLHNEAVYLPLTYQTNRAIYSDRVQNVTFNPSSFEIPMERMAVE